jgi:hypothetical protein
MLLTEDDDAFVVAEMNKGVQVGPVFVTLSE